MFMEERKNTGRIYLQNVDNANSHSSFLEEVAPIRQSNLCAEIDLPTKPLNDFNDENGEIALCTLSAINWGKIKTPEEFAKPCELAVRGLDALLTYQDYPVKAAQNATAGRRPLGVGIINFINFMDGIDGLICGSIIVIFSTLNGEIHYLLPIIGNLTAFLYFNWAPSKIFMGDTGSLFLGTYLVSLMFSTSDGVTSITKVFLLCSPLFLDSITCLIRRIIYKKNIFEAHRSHLYQRLVSNGINHSVVASIYILSIALLSIIYLYSNMLNLGIVSLLIFILGVFLDRNYAISFHKT